MANVMKHPMPPPFAQTKASPTSPSRGIRQVEEVSIKLASPLVIRRWATTRFYGGTTIGAITSAETLHYRTLKPVFGGLFCERIFGPVKDWECQCGRVRFNRPPKIEMWCPKCVVQITRSSCRRHRFGYIPLGTPIFHLWYQRGDHATNPLQRALRLKPKVLREFLDARYMMVAESFILTSCTISGSIFRLKKWDNLLYLFTYLYPTSKDIRAPWKTESKVVKEPPNFLRFRYLPNMLTYAFWTVLKRRNMAEAAKRMTKYLRLSHKNEVYIRSNKKFLRALEENFHHKKLYKIIKKEYKAFKKQFENDAKDRKEIISSLIFTRQCFLTKMRPEWTFIQNLPVLPPDLRPILQMSNGTLAISDVNELYRLVLFRSMRLRKLILLDVPEIIVCQEIRLVEDAVSAVLDNGRLQYPVKRTVMFEVKEPLRSLADRIVGKEGRFRQNLLGKRVDYSGRSVIIVGPTLRLWECGLPREMAVTLFQPLLLYRLLHSRLVTTIRNAKRFIEMYPMTILEMLHSLVSLHPIILNRAPTLHRMGMQAFLPRIIPGRAIQLHPFVCPAFNADFDGDQMAVHIPLVPQSIIEARLLLFAPLNWLSPATGDPSLLPSQDIILGIYYLTLVQIKSSQTGLDSTSRLYTTDNSSHFSLSQVKDVKKVVWIHTQTIVPIGETPSPLCTLVKKSGCVYTIYSASIRISNTYGNQTATYVVTTLGRQLFHTYLPHGQANEAIPLYGACM